MPRKKADDTVVKEKAPRKPKKPSHADMCKLQCEVCPLVQYKAPEKVYDYNEPTEVLVISTKESFPTLYPYAGRSRHLYLIECAEEGDKLDTVATTCCVSRKLDQIEKQKPKVVVTVGYQAFKAIEIALGHAPKGICDNTLLPCCTETGHQFWLIAIPDFRVKDHMKAIRSLVEYALKTEPHVEQGNDDGIIFVTSSDEIDPAFDWLEQQEYVAFDIETNQLKPYIDDPRVLTIAIGTGQRVYAFPIGHPETPTHFDVNKVMKRLWQLSGKVQMIAHNTAFEVEQLERILPGFSFHCRMEDTMAQAYLLTTASRSLDACIRRAFGFSLKVLSEINVLDLMNTPLERVLSYNAKDTKYTHKLFFFQAPMVTAEGQDKVYQICLSRIPAVVLMQKKGLHLDVDFINAETAKTQAEYKAALEKWYELPEVEAYMAQTASDDCNPFSNKAIPILCKEFCGAPKDQTSFDEEHLSKWTHPVGKLLVKIRKLRKLYSTYLLPYNQSIEGGGEFVFADGKIHPSFNALRAITGRFTSSNPNAQNFPSRGGNKRYRNVIKAPDGYAMAAADEAQIEYRMIASIAEDEEMIKAIKEGLDVHMYWALRLLELFPEKVKDLDDQSQIKEFRSTVKNTWTFPLCFGSSNRSIAENLKISDTGKLDKMIEEFWAHHTGVKAWHERLEEELEDNGFITNPFGRKFRSPLSYNEMINYGIQSTAGDIVNAALVKLARYSHEMSIDDLAPVIQIHDDLTLYIKEERVEELLPIIIETMIDDREYQDWLRVPLAVEVAVGYSWGGLEPIGDFSSDTWDFKLAA